MGRLHELLAVEPQLEGTAKKIMEETTVTFTKKGDHFTGYAKRYEPYREGKEHEVPPEEKSMVTTVPDKLCYTFESIEQWLDGILQKEATNQRAMADIEIDGQAIATNIPATYLLGLETKLKLIREMIEHVPTLTPGITWELDPMKGEHVYIAKNTNEKLRTQKVTKPVVLYPHSDKHPAQVKEVSEDVVIGKYIETHWSGMISPAEKSEMLERVDTLMKAVKQARQRANNQEVVPLTIGRALIDYILS